MDSLVARTAAIASRARELQPKRADNRAADPQMAKFVDDCRRLFGAELTYVRWPDGREWRR